MNTYVKKWGNSLAIRIPKAIVEEAGLNPNDEIQITMQNGQIFLTPPNTQTHTLYELLAGVTPDNLHGDEWERL